MSAALAPASRSHGAARRILRRLMRHRAGRIGLALAGLLVVTALFAPWLMPFDPAAIDYGEVLTAPGRAYLLGTDEIGRDILSRVIQGSRVSLEVVVVSITLALVTGSVIGMVAGFARGVADEIIMRVMDGLLAFPTLVLALAIVAVLGPSLLNAIIAISIVNVPGFARLVRGQVLVVRELEFVQAARALGMADWQVMLRHVWPSVVGDVIVYASLRGSTAIVTESSLSFLGLGVQPPTPSWGGMLSTGMQYLDAWWLSVFPGGAIFLAILGLNFLGDGLRDAMDARLND